MADSPNLHLSAHFFCLGKVDVLGWMFHGLTLYVSGYLVWDPADRFGRRFR